MGSALIFIKFQESFDFLSYFFNDLLIIEQCVIQTPIIFYFLLLLLLLSSSFIALLSDSIQGVISIFLYLLRLALCPKILPILENVPWPSEKNVYCAVAG
jgi:hypothetical protein